MHCSSVTWMLACLFSSSSSSSVWWPINSSAFFCLLRSWSRAALSLFSMHTLSPSTLQRSLLPSHVASSHRHHATNRSQPTASPPSLAYRRDRVSPASFVDSRAGGGDDAWHERQNVIPTSYLWYRLKNRRMGDDLFTRSSFLRSPFLAPRHGRRISAASHSSLWVRCM